MLLLICKNKKNINIFYNNLILLNSKYLEKDIQDILNNVIYTKKDLKDRMNEFTEKIKEILRDSNF